MNGYLQQLVDRSLDVTPVLQPRLPAWFEPVAAVAEEVAQEHTVAATTPPTLPPTPNAEVQAAAELPHPPEIPPRVRRPFEPAVPVVQPLEARLAKPPSPVEREIHEKREVVIERQVEKKNVPAPASPAPPRAGPSERAAPRPDPGTWNRAAPPASTFLPVPPLTRLVPVAVVKGPSATAPVVTAPITRPVQRGEKPLPVSALVPRSAVPPAPSPGPQPAPTLPGRHEKAQPSSEDPVIRVTIGRVEVRAIFAQPGASAPRLQPAAPLLSLEDYLKQKEGRGA